MVSDMERVAAYNGRFRHAGPKWIPSPTCRLREYSNVSTFALMIDCG
jgi:hypothetical protein